jgi:hypothetical protein
MVSKELRHTYGELVSDPNTWKSSAKQLFTAAAKFERRIRRMWDRELSGTGIASAYKRKHDAETAYLQNIYMMLLGFAVENNIKAIIAKKYQEIVRTTAQKSGKLPDLLKSHDLPKLARRAGLELNTHESGALRRVSLGREGILLRFLFPNRRVDLEYSRLFPHLMSTKYKIFFVPLKSRFENQKAR